MDFDDVDDPFQTESKPSKFAPKSSKFQPKAKAGAKVQPKAEPKVEPPPPQPPVVVAVKKEDAAMNVDDDKVKNGGKLGVKEEFEERKVAKDNEDVIMEEKEVVEEEDYVVAEYDVYFVPNSDPQTQLYVMQYPLRPSWRPYELEQRCTEVRVKPNSAEMEVDLLIETDSDNHDPRFPGAADFNKQTLSSPGRLPQATTYAVGVLAGKKLYVNPIHAAVQLRPSMEHLDSGESKKKHNLNNNDALALSGPSRKQSKQMDPKPEESWVTLKYHSSATELAERYLRMMVTEQRDPLQFLMKPYDYLNSLCPGAVIEQTKSAGPSRRFLLSLPLEERLKTWLIEVSCF